MPMSQMILHQMNRYDKAVPQEDFNRTDGLTGPLDGYSGAFKQL